MTAWELRKQFLRDYDRSFRARIPVAGRHFLVIRALRRRAPTP